MTTDLPATPVTSDLLTPPQPPQPERPAMTPEAAAFQRVKMLGDAGFRDRVARGDPEASKQWKDVNRALNPPVDQTTAEGKLYNDRMQALSYFKAKADLPAECYDHVAADGPVSLKERQDALFAKERLFKDKAWVRRYLDGDRQANSEAALIAMILGSRIGTHDEIEEFKAAAAKRLSGNAKNK